MRVLLLLSFYLFGLSRTFQPLSRAKRCSILRSTNDDAPEAAEPLPLTAQDLQRLSALRSRQKTIPIMILDAMLPKQRLIFRSSDEKFAHLIEHCLHNTTPLMGMLGLNPHTGRPINRGVTIPIRNVRRDFDVIEVDFVADQRIEIQGEPWLDETKSFYLAEVEIVDGAEETLTEEDKLEAERISETLPTILNEWVDLCVSSGATDQEGMKTRLASLGPMPDETTERALWLAAAINPLPSLGVALEIRPAMLAATNDLDRMILCKKALQSSMDHLSGKRRLF